MLEIREIVNQQEWESFLNEATPPTFLHSWEWGEFQRESGNRIYRLGIFDDVELQGVALVIVVRARRGSFLLVPHGPVIKARGDEGKVRRYLKELVVSLKEIAKKERVAFIRVAPILEDSKEHRALFKEFGFREAPLHVHAERLWVKEIDKADEELLQEMRKTTRYLIRQSLRNREIAVEVRSDVEGLRIFWRLYKALSKRHSFTPFSFEYLHKELEAFNRKNAAAFILGKRGDEYLAGAFVVFAHSSGFYHHGASFPSKIPVAYRVQWEAMQEAKRRGCRVYNFWGIAPDALKGSRQGALTHPWAGLSLFKKGFGGGLVDLVPTNDLVITPRYWLNYGIEKLRRFFRHL